jgi:hypothetical protein
MNKLLCWFLYTRLGQWLGRLLSGGWCFVRKNDPRFTVTYDENALRYEGDPSAAPDKGPGNQRNAWKDWVIFYIPPRSYYYRFIVIDIYNGQRMACFKKHPNGIFAIRAGHEAGTIRIGTREGNYASGDNELKPVLLTRWRENNPWTLAVAKDQVLFI